MAKVSLIEALGDAACYCVGGAPFTMKHDETSYSYTAYRWRDDVSEFLLTHFQNCRSLIISYGAWISNKSRGKGIGQARHQFRLAEAQKMGNYIICTVNADNAVQKHILEKNGWRMLDSFKSKEECPDEDKPQPQFGPVVEIWGRKLYAPDVSELPVEPEQT